MNQTANLKPVIFFRGDYNERYRQNSLQQKMLLRALTVTDNPRELRKMIGVRTVAEVYRTLDKLAMRKDYHESLVVNGVSFDSIVKGIKEIAEASESDAVRLKAYQTFLRSVGMDKYEEQETSNTTWEEVLAQAAKNKPKEIGSSVIEGDYEVKVPETPPEEHRRIEEEREIGKSLYE